ncbi:MAG: transcriptional repressor [Lachnospiraceae bacterium]|nr:transcriptional repressor [Lachnospiraceae bacterium]
MQFDDSRKNMVYGYFADNPHLCATASQLKLYLDNRGEKMCRSTIYRWLGILVEEGYLSEIKMGNTPARYRLLNRKITNRNKVVCRCRICNRFYYTFLSEYGRFCTKVEKDTGFSIERENSIFTGVCKSCKENG